LVFKVARILDAISDGRWHNIAGLAKRLKLAGHEVEARLEFLNKFELVKIDGEDRRVKINEDFQLLSELSTI
jgi:DNA-binding IclR family transcriptional regulator